MLPGGRTAAITRQLGAAPFELGAILEIPRTSCCPLVLDQIVERDDPDGHTVERDPARRCQEIDPERAHTKEHDLGRTEVSRRLNDVLRRAERRERGGESRSVRVVRTHQEVEILLAEAANADELLLASAPWRSPERR